MLSQESRGPRRGWQRGQLGDNSASEADLSISTPPHLCPEVIPQPTKPPVLPVHEHGASVVSTGVEVLGTQLGAAWHSAGSVALPCGLWDE